MTVHLPRIARDGRKLVFARILIINPLWYIGALRPVSTVSLNAFNICFFEILTFIYLFSYSFIFT